MMMKNFLFYFDFEIKQLVELLNGRAVIATGSSATGSGTGSTSGHATGSTASSRVDLGHDGVNLLLDLLLLVLELVSGGSGVGVEPLDALLDNLLKSLLSAASSLSLSWGSLVVLRTL